MTYLGHVVSEEGIQTDPRKVEVIQKWPILTNATEEHSYVGFTNYYHKLIKKYAQVARHLYKLQENEIQSNGIKNVQKLLINLKSCALGHQFWHMQISRNSLGYKYMHSWPGSSFLPGA